MMDNLLSNDELLLRAVEPSDADIIFEWENNTANWLVSNTLVPFSCHIITQYALNANQDIFEAKQLRLMVVEKSSNRSVGSIDMFEYDPFHQRAGLGILINSSEDRKKGYAFQAIELLKKYAFGYLHMKQLYCGIGANNVNSMKLFEKAGFVLCGIRKAWYRSPDGWEDEHFYQCLSK